MSDFRERIEHFLRAMADAQMFYSEAERVACNLEVENAKLRKLCADLYAEMLTYSTAPDYNASVWAPKLRELGVEVDG